MKKRKHIHSHAECCARLRRTVPVGTHDTVEKDRRSVRGFADPQRNEGVATAVCGSGHVNMSKDLAKCPPELRVSGPEQSKRLRPTGRKPGVVAGHGYAGAARRRRGAKGCSGSRVASSSRGDADPGFGFGFGLPCLSARSQIV